MAKKKADIVPMVDIIKSGVNMTDFYKDHRDEDGRIRITRSKKGQKIREESLVSDLVEHEKKLAKLKKEMESLNLDKDDVKEIKKDIKDKKKKKKDKKKKNKSSEDSYMSALLDAVPADLATYISEGGEKGLKKKKKKDKKNKKKQEKLKGLSIKEKKKRPESGKDQKEKEDKSKSEVMQRFKEVEKITRENIKEIDTTLDVVDARIKDIMKSSERVRGKDTALANYLNAKVSLISTRQKAATDIMSNRAKVYDIEMKKEKSATGSSASDADIIARIFPGIAMGGSMDAATKSFIAGSGKNKDGKKKKKKKIKSGGGFEYDDDDDLLLKREKDLMKSGDIEYSDYDSNIEWEGQFDVAVKKSFQTGDWKFIAIDDDGNVIKGVPKSMLPSKKAVQMKFDDEKDVAYDMNSNRAFKVFQVPQI